MRMLGAMLLGLLGLALAALAVTGIVKLLSHSDQGQSGTPVPGDPHAGMTSYCLPDGSGMRVYERPFPQGGTQPLFSVVYTGGLVGNPAFCAEVTR